jgi:hypothetical protein
MEISNLFLVSRARAGKGNLAALAVGFSSLSHTNTRTLYDVGHQDGIH